MTPPVTLCRQCQQPIPATAPAGECPACLLRLSLGPSKGKNSAGTPRPSPAELQARFPKLEILDLIGGGGAGTVYRAVERDTGRTVALKLLNPGRADDPVFVERFLREAQTLAHLKHPNIVTVYEAVQSDGLVYLLMEYVDGASLRDCLAAGRLSPAETLRLVPQLCDAIQHAHDQGVIHRDIKPENVLIDGSGNVKIVDFGLAKTSWPVDFTLTASGERMGTARYMAPEQWQGKADHRADIYSLGVVFYEMLTGEVPTPHCEAASSKADSDPRLDRVVERSLQPDPSDRYQKAAELKADVQRIAGTRNRRPLWMAVAAAVLVLAAYCVVSAWPVRTPMTASPMPAAVASPPTTTRPFADIPFNSTLNEDWEWTAPVNLGPGVNSAFDEGTPAVSADGLTLVFHSNRPGGIGGVDLWMSTRRRLDEPFSHPTNLGPIVNSQQDELDPSLTADGLSLLFAAGPSDGDTTLRMCERSKPGAPWSAPHDVSSAVNSPARELRPWLTADGLSLSFSRAGAGGLSLWVTRRSTPAEAFSEPWPMGKSARLRVTSAAFSPDGHTVLCTRSGPDGERMWLSPAEWNGWFQSLQPFGAPVAGYKNTSPVLMSDYRTVLFQSQRPGGAGGSDLWQTTRKQRATAR